ncbi:MAG: ABC transporter permease [Tissierellia bacterium]|nr:ABC transporter permease [Tissierellia bacterium]
MKQGLLMIIIGMILISFVLSLVIFAPWIAKYDPTEMDSSSRLIPHDENHLMGTDNFGRDIFSRLLYGGRITLPISFVTLLLTAIVGICLGIIAGFNYGKLIDIILMRIVDAIMAVPFIAMAMAISALFGRKLENLLIVVIIIWWAPFARLARSLVISQKNNQAVIAARVLGANNFTIVIREILPNIIFPLIINLTLEFSSLILSLSTLSFFGLGSQPPTPEWGGMLADGRKYFLNSKHVLLWPSLFIIVTVLGLNLIGEGLRDYYDPYEILPLK